MGGLRKIIIGIAAVAITCSCGSKGYDAAESERLCSMYDNGQEMDNDAYAALIRQEQLAFDGVREKMEKLIGISEPLEFNQEYIRLKNDTAFVSMVSMSERMWRVIVLSRPYFSEDNAEHFSELMDVRKIIDLYNDDIVRRLDMD